MNVRIEFRDMASHNHVSLSTIVVSDYDEAIDFYVNTLGFT